MCPENVSTICWNYAWMLFNNLAVNVIQIIQGIGIDSILIGASLNAEFFCDISPQENTIIFRISL